MPNRSTRKKASLLMFIYLRKKLLDGEAAHNTHNPPPNERQSHPPFLEGEKKGKTDFRIADPRKKEEFKEGELSRASTRQKKKGAH